MHMRCQEHTQRGGKQRTEWQVNCHVTHDQVMGKLVYVLFRLPLPSCTAAATDIK